MAKKISIPFLSDRKPAVVPDSPMLTFLTLGQGLVFLVSGIWPILHRKSFERVTGPKTDFWLVRTVGTLIAVIGAVIALAGWKRRVTPEIAVLGIGSALGLAAIDVLYVERRRISRIYLLDALMEIGFVIEWLIVLLWKRK